MRASPFLGVFKQWNSDIWVEILVMFVWYIFAAKFSRNSNCRIDAGLWFISQNRYLLVVYWLLDDISPLCRSRENTSFISVILFIYFSAKIGSFTIKKTKRNIARSLFFFPKDRNKLWSTRVLTQE